MLAVLAALALLGVGLGVAVYRRALTLVDERVGKGSWMVPSAIHPASLRLTPGGAFPPGTVADVLLGLGYTRVEKPAAPGEFSAAGGKALVMARLGWPGLADVPSQPVELTVKDGVVVELKRRGGGGLSVVVLPPSLLAEVRGPDGETRKPVALEDMANTLREAVLAVEDKRFYDHGGIDVRSFGRAIMANVASRGHAQGGSTITQQLAKNLFLTQEKTYSRKVKEAFFALALEERFNKDQILELYLNAIYLGQRGAVSVLGMGQAAQAYFSKDVGRLNLEEAALLAGMIQAPNAYAPDRHAEKARTRRDLVLKLMLDQERIKEADYKRAIATAPKVKPSVLASRAAPYAVDDLTDALGQQLPGVDLSSDGLHVETTLDARLQKLAEAALVKGLDRVDAQSSVELEGAMVVTRPSTGEVLALVGGKSYARSQFNRATRGKRQPGSVFKPLIMLGALHMHDNRVGPDHVLEDAPLTLTVAGKAWSPRNSDRKFHGQVTMREALEQSLNVPTVRLAQQVGFRELVGFLGGLGLQGRVDPVPSLALGVFEMSPWEVAGAYSAVASDGNYRPPYLLRRVTDSAGRVVLEGAPSQTRVASEQEAYMVRDMMRGVMDRGTARNARALGYAHPACGKTGTTSDGKDAWFVGFDGAILTVIWVGADVPVATGLTGGQAAMPVWVDFMKAVRRDVAPPVDEPPVGLVAAQQCDDSKDKALTACPNQHHEVFYVDAAPEEYCSMHAGTADRIEALLRAIPLRMKDLFGAIQD